MLISWKTERKENDLSGLLQRKPAASQFQRPYSLTRYIVATEGNPLSGRRIVEFAADYDVGLRGDR